MKTTVCVFLSDIRRGVRIDQFALDNQGNCPTKAYVLGTLEASKEYPNGLVSWRNKKKSREPRSQLSINQWLIKVFVCRLIIKKNAYIVNPLFTDNRYNDNIRYNDYLNVTKPSPKR